MPVGAVLQGQGDGALFLFPIRLAGSAAHRRDTIRRVRDDSRPRLTVRRISRFVRICPHSRMDARLILLMLSQNGEWIAASPLGISN